MTKRQTMIYKTLQKIEQHQPHCSGVESLIYQSNTILSQFDLTQQAIIVYQCCIYNEINNMRQVGGFFGYSSFLH